MKTLLILALLMTACGAADQDSDVKAKEPCTSAQYKENPSECSAVLSPVEEDGALPAE